MKDDWLRDQTNNYDATSPSAQRGDGTKRNRGAERKRGAEPFVQQPTDPANSDKVLG